MITAETAQKIAFAYREIEAAEELLKQVAAALDKSQPQDVRDVFGRRQRGLQLGIPSGENGHRLLDVSYELAVPVIEAHVARKWAELALLGDKAFTELGNFKAAVDKAEQAQ